jgi:hypothetical protein
VTLVAILLEALAARTPPPKGEEEDGGGGTESASAGAQRGAEKNKHRGSCCESGSMCIIFTSSVEETHRLCLLLQIMNAQAGTESGTESGDKKNNKTQQKPNKNPIKTQQKPMKRLFGGTVEEMSRTVRESDRARVMQACSEGSVRYVCMYVCYFFILLCYYSMLL